MGRDRVAGCVGVVVREMSFADWKKNNKVMDKYIPDGYKAMAYVVAHSAYKAGERQGRKDVRDIALSAMELRKLIEASRKS